MGCRNRDLQKRRAYYCEMINYKLNWLKQLTVSSITKKKKTKFKNRIKLMKP